MKIVTVLSFISHSTVVLATHIHDTILRQFTIMLQNSETNKALHNIGHKRRAQNVV